MEEWNDIPGYENYQASNIGNIRSVPHLVSSKNRWGEYKKIVGGRELSKVLNGYGYKKVVLSLNGTHTTVKVHKLVYLAFFGQIKKGMVIDHVDGDRGNNKINNIQQITQSENIIKSSKL